MEVHTCPIRDVDYKEIIDTMKELFELYAMFFRIGGLTFGGGLTMLPMLKYELVEKKHWVEESELLDYYAVGQCTPGIIAVNVATFVGYKRKGIPGGIFATLGMVSPSLIIVSILALFLEQFMSNQIVAHAVAGIKIVVCALMLNTLLTMAKKTIKGTLTAVVCIIAFLISMFTPFPSVLMVIIAGVIGVVLNRMGRFEA